MKIEDVDFILKAFGAEEVTTTKKDWRGLDYQDVKLFKRKPFERPADDIYVEIEATSTNETIGRVIDVEVDVALDPHVTSSGVVYQDTDQIIGWRKTLILEIDGRKKPCRICYSYARILHDHDGSTQYVRNVRKGAGKTPVLNPVNKYQQELKQGDWVVGVRWKGIQIGRVSRWTNSNVWGVPHGAEVGDKSKEFKFDSISETFLMPNDDHVKALTWAALKGYKGN